MWLSVLGIVSKSLTNTYKKDIEKMLKMPPDKRLSICDCPEYEGHFALKFKDRFVAVGFESKPDIRIAYKNIKLPPINQT